jgi:hypothetical protein
MDHVELSSAIVRVHSQEPRIKLTSARSVTIEETFVSVRQVIDEPVRLVDPYKLTLAYLGSCVSALSVGHRFCGVHM